LYLAVVGQVAELPVHSSGRSHVAAGGAGSAGRQGVPAALNPSVGQVAVPEQVSATSQVIVGAVAEAAARHTVPVILNPSAGQAADGGPGHTSVTSQVGSAGACRHTVPAA
jgi:hypothetical protein